MPRSPTTRHGPSRRASHKSLGKFPLIMNHKMAALGLKSPFPSTSGDLSGQERSEKDLEKLKQQLEEPVLMPLPDSGADGPLDWAHLVDAAKAFEGRFYLSRNLWKILSLTYRGRSTSVF